MTFEKTTSRIAKDLLESELFVLDDPKKIWKIQSGYVALFAIRIQEGKLKEERRYLFALETGEYLFGFPCLDSKMYRIVAIPRTTVKLQDCDPPNLLSELNSSSQDLLKKWLKQLSSVLDSHGISLPLPEIEDRFPWQNQWAILDNFHRQFLSHLQDLEEQPSSSVSKSIISASSPAVSNTLDALLALRGVACLMVIVYHCYPPSKAIMLGNMDLSWLVFSRGSVGVWIFFCLSGYLMGKAFFSGRYDFNQQGVLNFWRNRALRILPLYSFVVLFLSILVYPEILKVENLGVLLRICTFTYQPFLQNQTHPEPNFNFSVWSLSTEVQFYLIVPFVYAIFRYYTSSRRTIWLTLIGVIFAVFSLKLLIWLTLQEQIIANMYYAFKYWYAPLATNLDIFLIGFLMNPLIRCMQQKTAIQQQDESFYSKFRISKVFKPHHHKSIAVLLLIILYLLTAYHYYYQELLALDPASISPGIRTPITIFILQPLTALTIAYFIYVFEFNAPNVPHQKLSFSALLQNPYRALEILGNLSYGLYLWHYPIIENISSMISSSVGIETFYLQLTTTLALSLILATVTYYTVELPAARSKIY